MTELRRVELSSSGGSFKQNKPSEQLVSRQHSLRNNQEQRRRQNTSRSSADSANITRSRTYVDTLTTQDPLCHCYCQECIVSDTWFKGLKSLRLCRPYLKNYIKLKDLHYTFERRLKADGNEEDDDDVARQGIVPMETPFLMDQVMDDGIAACSIM